MLSAPKQTPNQMASTPFHGDGLIDIAIGVGLLVAAFGLYTDLFWLAAIYSALVVSVMPGLKKRITAPRLEPSRLSAEQLEKNRRAQRIMMIALSGTLLLGVLAFGLTTLTAFQSVAPWPVLAVGIALVLVSLLAAMAYAYNLKRFYAYAALALLIVLGAVLLRASLPSTLLLLGGLFLAAGSTVMVRFIQQQPVRTR